MFYDAEKLMKLAAPRVTYDMQDEAQLARITGSDPVGPSRPPELALGQGLQSHWPLSCWP